VVTPEGNISVAQTLSRLISAVLLLAVGPAGWAQEVSPALLQAAQAHFTRHFKRVVGLPPQLYQQLSKNVQDPPAVFA